MIMWFVENTSWHAIVNENLIDKSRCMNNDYPTKWTSLKVGFAWSTQSENKWRWCNDWGGVYKFRWLTLVHNTNTLLESKKKREPLCGDTNNSLAKVDEDFHCSKNLGGMCSYQLRRNFLISSGQLDWQRLGAFL